MQWNDLNWEGWAVSKVSLYYIIIEPGKIGGFWAAYWHGLGLHSVRHHTTDRAVWLTTHSTGAWTSDSTLKLFFHVFLADTDTGEIRNGLNGVDITSEYQKIMNTRGIVVSIIENIFNHHIFPNQTGQALCLLSYHSLQSLDVTVHFQPVIYPTKIIYKNTIRVGWNEFGSGQHASVTILKVSIFQIE